jgi:hypothetical protein
MSLIKNYVMILVEWEKKGAGTVSFVVWPQIPLSLLGYPNNDIEIKGTYENSKCTQFD